MSTIGSMLATARQWASRLKRDIAALWIATHDPRTPTVAKVVAAVVVAYALSPIDLIPDFIPVLGYLDDILLVPLGIMFVVSLIPADLMEEYRQQASEKGVLPRSFWAAAVILFTWGAVAGGVTWWIIR